MITAAILLVAMQPIPLPPSRYQDGIATTIEFGTVETRCQHLAGPGKRVLACANKKSMVVPHPCQSSGEFAKIVCHELGHVNGWPGTHPAN